jgi:hypothetical protein
MIANLDLYLDILRMDLSLDGNGNKVKMKLGRGLQNSHVWCHAFGFLQATFF